MKRKWCDRCEKHSYSASNRHRPWYCPHCGKDLINEKLEDVEKEE